MVTPEAKHPIGGSLDTGQKALRVRVERVLNRHVDLVVHEIRP
jgi:hypothetical protein